jgi:hypothetical protein
MEPSVQFAELPVEVASSILRLFIVDPPVYTDSFGVIQNLLLISKEFRNIFSPLLWNVPDAGTSFHKHSSTCSGRGTISDPKQPFLP